MDLKRTNWGFINIFLVFCMVTCRAQTSSPLSSFPICGGMECEACIPLQRQTAPGIGLDLSLNHGTAVIQFHNGTIHDVPLVHANSIYQAAMRDLVMEAKLEDAGQKTNLPPVGRPKSASNPQLQDILPTVIFKAFQYLACPKAEKVISYDQWVNAVAGMLEALKLRIEPISATDNTDIWLSIPDSTRNFIPAMERFRMAAGQAGLAIKHFEMKGLTAMRELHGIDSCWDDDCHCEGDQRHPNVLVADLSNQTLSLSFFTRWMGVLETSAAQQECLVLRPYHHSIFGDEKSLNSDQIQQIEVALRNFVARRDQPIDRVVLTGSEATHPLFLSAMRAIFGSREDLREDTYVRDAQSHTFASARQGARQSRLSNMGAFLPCYMPARCFHGKEGAVRMEIADKVNSEFLGKSEL